MNAQFDQLRRTWHKLGQNDPFWAVLSWPEKSGNRWDVEGFLATGEDEIAGVLQSVSTRFPDVPRSCALDFGCGVGRLSRALSSHFDRVIGIDIAASMVRKAQEVNTDRNNCEFVVNERPDLSIISSGSIDLVYSNIVLQHMPEAMSDSYIREFVRIVSDRGIAVFQALDQGKDSLKARLNESLPRAFVKLYRRARYGPDHIQMHVIPKERVHSLVREAGGKVVGDDILNDTGNRFINHRYFVRRG